MTDNSELPISPLVNDNGHPFHASQVAFDNRPLTSGLNKREYFAGLALQGWLARCSNVDHVHKLDPKSMADVAVSMADALLERLEDGL